MRRALALLCLWAAGPALVPAAAQEAAPQPVPAVSLTNGDLSRWEQGLPAGWEVGVGARNGTGPEALLTPAGAAGLSLAGDRTTKIWKSVSQQFTPKAGECYRLTFEARVAGRKREGNQYGNCWIGFFFANAQGQRLSVDVYDVREREWTAGRLVACAPPGTAAATVVIFLSQTGTLQARKLALAHAPKNDARTHYDLCVAAMDRHYSYFAHKHFAWRAYAASRRSDIDPADGPPVFAAKMQQILSQLEDLHISIQLGDGPLMPTHRVLPHLNLDIDHVFGRVHNRSNVGKQLVTGRTKEGFGYALVTGLPSDAGIAAQMRAALAAQFQRPGLLIDLRANSGGDERTAQTMIADLVDQRRVYAMSVTRAGAGHAEFTPPTKRVIKPAGGGRTYDKPIVVLVGPGCVSSGEAMALMFKALPNATLVGQPTRGASGNPKPVRLPNGVSVWFSRWVAMDAAGKPFEGRGVQPDEVVPHPADADGDPTFERGIALLMEKIGAAKPKDDGAKNG